MTMVMSPDIRTISASQFKAQCLAMLDEVAATGEEIVVTKRGRAVARVLAASEPDSLRGSVTFNVPDEELIEPVDIAWDAASR
jgi:prevent-host-death family protein